MRSGVYIITNLINNKYYVGYSVNVSKRLSGHKTKLRQNKHSNIHLQNSVNEYGLDNFSFDPLEYYPIEICPSMENWWCNMLDTHDREHGYNIKYTSADLRAKINIDTRKKISEKNLGRKLSTSTREKISLGLRGRIPSKKMRESLSIVSKTRVRSIEERVKISTTLKEAFKSGKIIHPFKGRKHKTESFIDQCKPIVQYNKKGEFVKAYSSVSEAIRETGIVKCREAASGKRKTAGKYIWYFIDNKDCTKDCMKMKI